MNVHVIFLAGVIFSVQDSLICPAVRCCNASPLLYVARVDGCSAFATLEQIFVDDISLQLRGWSFGREVVSLS